MKESLTPAQLREFIFYDPETGVFTWLCDGHRNRKAKRGDIAGRPDAKGYIGIGIKNRWYSGHRLAFFYMVGEWPKYKIDHKDGNPSNNRWSNLREATHAQNIANGRHRVNSKSPLKGISWDAKRGLWQSGITHNYKRTGLGRYNCPASAHFAYLVAADKAFGEFARAA